MCLLVFGSLFLAVCGIGGKKGGGKKGGGEGRGERRGEDWVGKLDHW